MTILVYLAHEHEKKHEKKQFIISFHTFTQKINKYTNEADGSAYEGVEVATSSIDVGLSSGTTVPPRHTAEQDGLSDHYL